jgi:hypothetical protein
VAEVALATLVGMTDKQEAVVRVVVDKVDTKTAIAA